MDNIKDKNDKNDILIPRRVIFVIDKSGSMSGGKWDRTITATISALEQLRTGYDKFGIILFNNNYTIFPSQQEQDELLYSTNDENVNIAIEYIKIQEAGGGTEINRPLSKAIDIIKDDMDNENNGLYMNQIIFITDGKAHNTKQILKNVNNRNN